MFPHPENCHNIYWWYLSFLWSVFKLLLLCKFLHLLSKYLSTQCPCKFLRTQRGMKTGALSLKNMLIISLTFFFWGGPHWVLITLSQHVAKIMESRNYDCLPLKHVFLPWLKVCFCSLNSTLQHLLVVLSEVTVICRDQFYS